MLSGKKRAGGPMKQTKESGIHRIRNGVLDLIRELSGSEAEAG